MVGPDKPTIPGQRLFRAYQQRIHITCHMYINRRYYNEWWYYSAILTVCFLIQSSVSVSER